MCAKPVIPSWVTITAFIAALGIADQTAMAGSSSTSGASVSIIGTPSGLGAISNIVINVPLLSQSVQTDTVPAAQGDNIFSTPDEEAILLQPAVFNISGVPYQAFSIIIPSASSSTGAGGTVEFMDFQHNAGQTPFISADGSASFAVGVRIKLTDLGLSPASGETLELDPTAISEAQPEASPENKPLPKSDPFGLRAIADGYMQVLVSYN